MTLNEFCNTLPSTIDGKIIAEFKQQYPVDRTKGIFPPNLTEEEWETAFLTWSQNASPS